MIRPTYKYLKKKNTFNISLDMDDIFVLLSPEIIGHMAVIINLEDGIIQKLKMFKDMIDTYPRHISGMSYYSYLGHT